MAVLSSMTRMRRLASGAELGTGGLRRSAWEFENEGRAVSRSVAHHAQRAAEFLRRERPAMQAEAVPGRAGREAVGEKPGNVLQGDAHPIVDDADAHARRCALDAQCEKLVGPSRLIACVLGVAHQIDQN